MGYFVIEANYSELEKEFKRIAAAPGPEAVAQLELTLARSFADATARVHVITGALRGSGKTATDVTAEGSWEGQMTWGGPSPGFLPKPSAGHPRAEAHPVEDETRRNEVVYAYYEKRRGEEHDYLAGQATYTDNFREAVVAAVRGDHA